MPYNTTLMASASRYPCTFLLVLLLGCLAPEVLAQNSTPTAPTGFLVMRVPQGPPDQLIRVLREVSEPIKNVVKPVGVSFKELLQDVCGGSYTNGYRRMILNLNNIDETEVKTSEIRSVNLLACPNVGPRTTVTIGGKDTVDDVLQRAMGITKDTPIRTTAAIKLNDQGNWPTNSTTAFNRILQLNGRHNSGIDTTTGSLSNLVGKTLEVPNTSRWTTIALKPGIDPRQVLRQIQEAANPGTQAFISAELKLIKPLSAADVAGTPCDPGLGAPPPKWPYDRDALVAALSRARDQASARLLRATIRISDTGLSGIGTYFPKDAMVPDPQWQPDRGDPNSIGQMGQYGMDAAGTGNVEPDAAYAERAHGTEVADLALGGTEFRSAYKKLYDLIGIDAAKIFRGPDLHYQVEEAAVANSLTASPPTPTIVNLSVGGSNEMNAFVTAMNSIKSTNLLVVVAAGNHHENLNGSDRVYPASYGRASYGFSQHMIVVGAADPEHHPTEFTARGDKVVDILAPGCRIRIADPSGRGGVFLHGTSVAAPLVSFAAALISSLGVQNPALIRKRIVAAADRESSAVGIVRSESVLNIPRTVEVFNDILVQGGQDKIVTWSRAVALDICEGRPAYDPSEILRLSSFQTQKGVRMVQVISDDDKGYQVEAPCTAKGEGITLLAPSGQKYIVKWQDFAALVPATLTAAR